MPVTDTSSEKQNCLDEEKCCDSKPSSSDNTQVTAVEDDRQLSGDKAPENLRAATHRSEAEDVRNNSCSNFKERRRPYKLDILRYYVCHSHSNTENLNSNKTGSKGAEHQRVENCDEDQAVAGPSSLKDTSGNHSEEKFTKENRRVTSSSGAGFYGRRYDSPRKPEIRNSRRRTSNRDSFTSQTSNWQGSFHSLVVDSLFSFL